MSDQHYSRTSFRVPAARLMTDAEAEGWLGSNMEVRLGDVLAGSGVITDVRIIENGAALLLTIESGGRACGACRHVHAEEEAPTALAPIGAQREPAGHDDLPVWVRVCTDWDGCKQRRKERGHGQDSAERAEAG